MDLERSSRRMGCACAVFALLTAGCWLFSLDALTSYTAARNQAAAVQSHPKSAGKTPRGAVPAVKPIANPLESPDAQEFLTFGAYGWFWFVLCGVTFFLWRRRRNQIAVIDYQARAIAQSVSLPHAEAPGSVQRPAASVQQAF